jgi:hypothetical protein
MSLFSVGLRAAATGLTRNRKQPARPITDQLAAGENRPKTSFAGKPTANAARKPQ